MTPALPSIDAMPVVAHPRDFDSRSGNRLEQIVFNHRLIVVLLCALLTLGMAYLVATRLSVHAAFEKMLPQSHPFIQTYLAHKKDLRALGNAVRVVVQNPGGSIFEPAHLDKLKHIHDEIYLTPGVDRSWMRSIWMPTVRWTEVTEEGYRGGPVMPPDFDGSPAAVQAVRDNVVRAGLVGSLVANDLQSSMIFVPLLDRDPLTGLALDDAAFAARLETIRTRHQAAAGGGAVVKIHVIGFATLVGDLVAGLKQVMAFFALSGAVAVVILYAYTRCARSTGLVVACSAVAVLWQLGWITALGFHIDPFSVLVPFLVFAIGVSHGAQKMNGIMQDIGRGTHRVVAARYTFRRLFLAGFTALAADAVGFAVLMVIDIPVIRDLALTASIGVAVLVVTNLLLLPVLLSFTGVNARAAARSLRLESMDETGRGLGALWQVLDRFTERRWALAALSVALVLALAGFAVSLRLQVGDLEPGAPELRADSRYNRDNAYVTSHYALSSDVFAVIVKTEAEQCLHYKTLQQADQLAWALEQLPGVQGTLSLVNGVRQLTAGSYDASPKFYTLLRNQAVLTGAARQASVNNPDLYNADCSVMPVLAFLKDHKADNLEQVLRTAQDFAQSNNDADVRFELAAGSAGIEAATNIVVQQANRTMLLAVYAAVVALCLLAFRSWRATVVAVLPLVLTSILCEALMVVLGMGVKVATLPVVALGVGIGVDYALYLVSVQLAHQRAGLSLRQAYQRSVEFTGRVVGLVGLTLACGVGVWAASPIKFQGDMGILLSFMFVLNMVGALVLIPALSHFLLPTVADRGGPSGE